MKTTLIALAAVSFFAGSVLAAGGAGSEKGPGDGMGMGGKSPGSMGAMQGTEHMRTTQKDRFQNMDTNRDGYITRDEAKNDESLTKKWKDADRNADGTIDASEFSAFETTPPQGTDR